MKEKIKINLRSFNLRYQAPLIISILVIIILIKIPTGYEEALNYQGTERCEAKVLSIDDSSIIDTGLIRSGDQRCEIKFLNGKFKGHYRLPHRIQCYIGGSHWKRGAWSI